MTGRPMNLASVKDFPQIKPRDPFEIISDLLRSISFVLPTIIEFAFVSSLVHFCPQKNNLTMCPNPFILILFETYFALQKSVKIPRKDTISHRSHKWKVDNRTRKY